jgi:hypothetical protein
MVARALSSRHAGKVRIRRTLLPTILLVHMGQVGQAVLKVLLCLVQGATSANFPWWSTPTTPRANYPMKQSRTHRLLSLHCRIPMFYPARRLK